MLYIVKYLEKFFLFSVYLFDGDVVLLMENVVYVVVVYLLY